MRVIENEQFFKVGLICDLRLNTFTKVGIINDTNYKDLLYINFTIINFSNIDNSSDDFCHISP